MSVHLHSKTSQICQIVNWKTKRLSGRNAGAGNFRLDQKQVHFGKISSVFNIQDGA